MRLGEIAKAKPAVAIGSYPFFDPQHGASTNVVLRARDPQKLAFAKRAVEDMLEGEELGSNILHVDHRKLKDWSEPERMDAAPVRVQRQRGHWSPPLARPRTITLAKSNLHQRGSRPP